MKLIETILQQQCVRCIELRWLSKGQSNFTTIDPAGMAHFGLVRVWLVLPSECSEHATATRMPSSEPWLELQIASDEKQPYRQLHCSRSACDRPADEIHQSLFHFQSFFFSLPRFGGSEIRTPLRHPWHRLRILFSDHWSSILPYQFPNLHHAITSAWS